MLQDLGVNEVTSLSPGLQKVTALVLLLQFLTLDKQQYDAKVVLLAGTLGIDQSVEVRNWHLVGYHIQVLIRRLALRKLFIVASEGPIGILLWGTS